MGRENPWILYDSALDEGCMLLRRAASRQHLGAEPGARTYGTAVAPQTRSVSAYFFPSETPRLKLALLTGMYGPFVYQYTSIPYIAVETGTYHAWYATSWVPPLYVRNRKGIR